MGDKFNSLEQFVLEKIKKIDSTAHLTRGSGCGNEILDISCKNFYIECRQNLTKANWIIDRKKDWLNPQSKLPLNSHKEFLLIKENKFGEKIVVMDVEAFFRLLNKGDD
jgi:hypothetical protein